MIDMIFGTIRRFCNSMENCEDCPYCQDMREIGHERCVFRETPEEWNSKLMEKCYIEMCVTLYMRDRENEENE